MVSNPFDVVEALWHEPLCALRRLMECRRHNSTVALIYRQPCRDTAVRISAARLHIYARACDGTGIERAQSNAMALVRSFATSSAFGRPIDMAASTVRKTPKSEAMHMPIINGTAHYGGKWNVHIT